MSETALTAPYVTLPPTQAELPYDDGEPMESQRHKLQMDLLIDALTPWLEQREDGYVGGKQVANLTGLSISQIEQLTNF
ncbi:hypothetical protein CEN47_06955 [Fischerella thermalis CCMEE 5319]|nr:hypothetical protein CEN47_06955 [Fischerella thermalis CCMEE 5319]